jgi:hypothetical protein
MFVPVHSALGKALSMWAVIENVLGRCYAYCKGGDEEAAMAEYWKKKYFNRRKDAAIKFVSPVVAGDDALRLEWDRLLVCLKAMATKRGELAHGSVGLWEGQPGIAPYYFARLNDNGVPPVVLHVADINGITNDFIDLIEQLDGFRSRLDAS